MPSSTDKIKQTFAIKPCQKLRGETNSVVGVVHLPDVRRIITCSHNDSLLLWDLESGERIGDAWQDDGDDDLGVGRITLSPNGKTVASGSYDGTVRLWDVETKKVVARWTRDSNSHVASLCWSTDGEHVLTGYFDGMMRVWNIRSGNIILGPIETGHERLYVATYFHDKTKIATGGGDENAIKIWDATTGKLLSTLEHDYPVGSLASTSDQKKLISGSFDGSVRIFDTATWKQIAILEGHQYEIFGLALFQNDSVLASVSDDRTICLWDLDTNTPVGSPMQREHVNGAAVSADGKLLVTFSRHTRRHYVWDIDTILKDPGLKSLLSISKAVQDTLEMLRAAKSLSVLNVTSPGAASRRPAKPERVSRLPQGFFDDPRDRIQSPTIPVTHVHPSAPRRRSFMPSLALQPHALLSQFSSLFRHSQPNTGEVTALQQLPRQNVSSRYRPPVVDVVPCRDRQPLYVTWRPSKKVIKIQQQQVLSQDQAQASTSPAETAATSMTTTTPQVTTAGAATTQSQLATTSKNPTLWTRFVFFICCASIEEYR